MLGHLKVKQVRRVQTLLSGLKKLRSGSTAAPTALRAQLDREWSAVQRAKGYPPSFPEWVLRVAHFCTFSPELPEWDWLHDLCQYLRYDADCLVRQQAKLRRKTFLYRVGLDGTGGSSKEGFRAMRAPEHPPFTEVPCEVELQVQRAGQCSSQEAVYYLPPHAAVQCPGAALLNGLPCEVVRVDQSAATIRGASLPEEGRLAQSFVACTATELHGAFSSFWGRLWQRDEGAACRDETAWPDFLALLERKGVPAAQIQIRSFAPDLWRTAIQRMPRQKATGICGWAPTDLKLLSTAAIEVLCHIFHQAITCGLPAHLLRARICVLAKVAVPDSIRQSRPITIFSTLYRIWSSVLTRQVLQQWQPQFPRTVAGSMPHSACRDVSYNQQHQIELALVFKRRRIGVSIDLVKCFNQLPWQPSAHMLRCLGVPSPEVDFWLNCLTKVRRHPCFMGDIGPGLACFNGAPEGDPFSVVVMAAVCRFAHHLQTGPGQLDTYVDNWAWASADHGPMAQNLEVSFDFLHSLQLPVDWKKSYCWAVSRADRLWWRSAGQDLFPTTTPVPCVSAATDLGVVYCFDRRAHALARDARLESNLHKLDRLHEQPRPVTEKASMVQRGVWPSALYGSESHCHCTTFFQKLRGRASLAIVGRSKIASPFLALGALTAEVQDPQAYCVRQQLLALRRAFQVMPDIALSILALATEPTASNRSCGPATALRMSLPRLGLSLSVTGCLKGPDNSRLFLDRCRPKELHRMVHRAWAFHVVGHVRHRNGLGQLDPPMPEETGRLLRKLTLPEQRVIARHVVGGFSSAAAKSKWDDECGAECLMCGAKQTKRHKVLECPALQSVRAPVQAFLDYVVDNWPHWIHGPFAVCPPDTEVHRLVFHTRQLLPPLPLPAELGLPGPRGFLRMFTDGSCAHPTLPLASRAS